MKRILTKRILTSGVLLFITMLALGQSTYPRDAAVCWTNPSLYEDGSVIQDGDLASIRITGTRHDGSPAFDLLEPAAVVAGSAQCATLIGAIPQPGTYEFVAYAITIDDTSSDASNSEFKKYTGKPQKITDLAKQ